MAAVDPQTAAQLIGERLVCLPIESLPVAHCVGAVLRENVYAERDQPPFDRVAMDGIALAAATAAPGARRFRMQALQAAGDVPLELTSPGHCIEVMTGTVLPGGCDTVVPCERVHIADGWAELQSGEALSAGRNIHRRASDVRQGALLLSAGTALRSPEVAIAAGAGMARLRVSTQPRVMVLSTGNELVEPGEPIAAHQVRRSNVYGVVAALHRNGFARVADEHLRDDAEEIRERLRVHLRTYDVLILSGGVSMGRFDLLPRVLPELGVERVLHGIAQRPGKPLWFGSSQEGCAVFALPGNPVSTLVCTSRYVVPALWAAMGAQPGPPERLALAENVDWEPRLTGFLPVRVALDDWARPWAHPVPTNGSGDFTSLAGTDGFVELPPGPNAYAKGFVTRLYRW
ncbi:MAG: molybdopterin molybdotransferase MoeA [Gammaproteobacteria bacterium]|nr:molybdopterin molybdotransferase MoeA [Gammaproteobacteria bacterium]